MSALRGKRHWQQVDADLRRTAVEVDARAAADRTARQVIAVRVAAVRATQPPVDLALVKAATHVMDRRRGQWHEVVRVNKTTVSVATSYSWTDRIPLADVVAVDGVRP